LQYRTTRLNEAVELIYTLDEGFDKKKPGQTKEIFDLSWLVPHPDFTSSLFLEDLGRLYKLNDVLKGRNC